MKKKLILVGLITCICISAKAQETNNETTQGKAIVQMFGNFYSEFGNETNSRGFELERSYLGYETKLGDGLSVKGVMDIGKSADVNDLHRIAYIKNAMVQWKNDKLSINVGLIPTTQFNYQDKFWGYRYIMKSFQDLYKFGSSADLGLSMAYEISEFASVDLIVVNGEGYKKVQKGNGLNYGLGTTLEPIDGLSLRLYAGLNESEKEDEADKYNFSSLLGYKTDRFTIAAEFSKMWNYSNTNDADLFGYSLFSSYKISPELEIYSRYDKLSSNSNWNSTNDLSMVILGAQFKLGEYIKLAPNFRMNMPELEGAKNEYTALLSCYLGF